MTTRELGRELAGAAYAAKVRVTPAGEVEVVQGDADDALYGSVEIGWYHDRLEVTAFGAGRASIAEGHLAGNERDYVVEIRPPSMDELMETVPGAD